MSRYRVRKQFVTSDMSPYSVSEEKVAQPSGQLVAIYLLLVNQDWKLGQRAVSKIAVISARTTQLVVQIRGQVKSNQLNARLPY